MPRAPSDNSIKAEKLYREGKKLTEIAKILGVPEGTVRRWKHDHKWDSKPPKQQSDKTERSETKKANVRKRGAPKGSQNHLKHGGYSKIFWDILDDDEYEMVMSMPVDEEKILEDEIRLYTARERRITKAINQYRKQKAELSISGVQRYEEKRSFKDAEEQEWYEEIVDQKVRNGQRMPGTQYSVTTNTEPKDSAIARLEKELSVVQGKKAEATRMLAQIRLEKQKLNGDAAKNDIVQAWIAGLTGGDPE